MNVEITITLKEFFPSNLLTQDYYIIVNKLHNNGTAKDTLQLLNYPFDKAEDFIIRKRDQTIIEIVLCKNHVPIANGNFVLSSNIIDNNEILNRMIVLNVSKTANNQELMGRKLGYSMLRSMFCFEFKTFPLENKNYEEYMSQMINVDNINEINDFNNNNNHIETKFISDYVDVANDDNNYAIENKDADNNKNKSHIYTNNTTNYNSKLISNSNSKINIISNESKNNSNSNVKFKHLTKNHSMSSMKQSNNVSCISNNPLSANISVIFNKKINSIESKCLPVDLTKAYLYTVRSSDNLLKPFKPFTNLNKCNNKNSLNYTINHNSNINRNNDNYLSSNYNSNNSSYRGESNSPTKVCNSILKREDNLKRKANSLISMVNFLRVKKYKNENNTNESEFFSNTTTEGNLGTYSCSPTYLTRSFEMRKKDMQKRTEKSLNKYLSKLKQYRKQKKQEANRIERIKKRMYYMKTSKDNDINDDYINYDDDKSVKSVTEDLLLTDEQLYGEELIEDENIDIVDYNSNIVHDKNDNIIINNLVSSPISVNSIKSVTKKPKSSVFSDKRKRNEMKLDLLEKKINEINFIKEISTLTNQIKLEELKISNNNNCNSTGTKSNSKNKNNTTDNISNNPNNNSNNSKAKASLKIITDIFFNNINPLFSKTRKLLLKSVKLNKRELLTNALIYNKENDSNTIKLYREYLKFPINNLESEIETDSINNRKKLIQTSDSELNICSNLIGKDINDDKVASYIKSIDKKNLMRSKYIKKMLLGILIKNIDKIKYSKNQLDELEYLAEKYEFAFEEGEVELNKQERDYNNDVLVKEVKRENIESMKLNMELIKKSNESDINNIDTNSMNNKDNKNINNIIMQKKPYDKISSKLSSYIKEGTPIMMNKNSNTNIRVQAKLNLNYSNKNKTCNKLKQKEYSKNLSNQVSNKTPTSIVNNKNNKNKQTNFLKIFKVLVDKTMQLSVYNYNDEGYIEGEKENPSKYLSVDINNLSQFGEYEFNYTDDSLNINVDFRIILENNDNVVKVLFSKQAVSLYNFYKKIGVK